MEHLVEFNSFFKRFKDAIKDREEVKVDPNEISDEIRSLLTFVDDEENIDVNIKSYKSSFYGDTKNVTNKGSKAVYLGGEKDFVTITIKHSIGNNTQFTINNDGEFVDTTDKTINKFDINLVKSDILSMIDYISKKYSIYKLTIMVREPKGNKVSPHTGWTNKITNSGEVGLKTFEDLDIELDAIRITIILN